MIVARGGQGPAAMDRHSQSQAPGRLLPHQHGGHVEPRPHRGRRVVERGDPPLALGLDHRPALAVDALVEQPEVLAEGDEARASPSASYTGGRPARDPRPAA